MIHVYFELEQVGVGKEIELLRINKVFNFVQSKTRLGGSISAHAKLKI